MHTEYYAVVEENNELLVSNEIRTTSAGMDGKPRNTMGCSNRFSISKGKRYGNRYSSQIRFHSLVTLEKLRGRELLLDGYMTKGNTVQKLYGGKEYEIERYQGEHANEYCVYEIKNGVRDGTAELFDDGMMNNYTESIGTGERTFNDVKSFIPPVFLHSLKQIVIGNECYKRVRVFELDGLSELESVKIGMESYSMNPSEPWRTKRADGFFRIVNCSELKSIQIGRYSFSDYRSFELSNLPSLQKINIGWQCFYRAPSLTLSGRTSCLVSPVDFPQLMSAQFGWEVFCHCRSVVFESE